MSNEIEQWKSRLYDLDKEREYVNNQLFIAIGKQIGRQEGLKEGQEISRKDEERRIKLAVDTAVAELVKK